MSAVVGTAYSESFALPSGATGQTFTRTASYIGGVSTAWAPTFTEIGGGAYRYAYTPAAAGLHEWVGTAGDGSVVVLNVQAVTASQSDPVGELTTQLNTALTQTDALALQVSALQAGQVSVTTPVSADGGRLTLVQGDSYAAAQSRQLSWSLTGQPDLTTATITLTIVSGTTLTKTAASVTNPASGSPTIAFVLTVAETAAFTPAKVGTFDLSATIGSDEITMARGRVFVEEDV